MKKALFLIVVLIFGLFRTSCKGNRHYSDRAREAAEDAGYSPGLPDFYAFCEGYDLAWDEQEENYWEIYDDRYEDGYDDGYIAGYAEAKYDSEWMP